MENTGFFFHKPVILADIPFYDYNAYTTSSNASMEQRENIKSYRR